MIVTTEEHDWPVNLGFVFGMVGTSLCIRQKFPPGPLREAAWNEVIRYADTIRARRGSS